MKDEAELDDSRMPFLEHLRELRTRLRNAIIFVIIGFGIAFSFKEVILAFLAKPLIEVWTKTSDAAFIAEWISKGFDPQVVKTMARLSGLLPLGQPELNFKSLIEPFWSYFSVALWGGLFLSSPFTFNQLWKFIAPGLYKNERRWGVSFSICAALLFCAGAAMCYALILPITYEFLLGFATENVGTVVGPGGASIDLGIEVALRPKLFLNEYIVLTRKLMLGFGIAFQLPLVIFFLSLVGAVTHRGLLKFNRWMIVIAFVVSAILTPPEIYSQVLLAGPLIAMYEISIVIAWVITRRRERREQTELDDSATTP